jgi:hypothetical protein
MIIASRIDAVIRRRIIGLRVEIESSKEWRRRRKSGIRKEVNGTERREFGDFEPRVEQL